ncbi:hypothetical protein [Frigoriflavimonas asaccharolytica]|uniref:Uncharacterized protein n=1 Tax=Frigoriflavimonas asaccharolytica TaxID=2735899 RepID=A0A8J8GD63_9FLAO|nr:hypothetical protein [Frigoriflavimonas asaccharolytica]NRS93592.1 hypothetical protein [Frigoriflavimonas asaccharolytica]
MDFEEFMDYIIFKNISVRNKYPNLNIQESDLITVLMASFLDKFESRLSLEFYDNFISEEEIDSVVENYDFNQIRNEVTFNFIIPEEIEELETKVKIKNNGKIFIIHKNDADPFPSNPHAHWLDSNLKIDLSNGKCYHIRKHIKTLSTKEFKEIREKADALGVELPKLT